MTYVYQQDASGVRRGLPFDPARCAASVMTRERFPRIYQCARDWVVEEEGHKWCRQHAPSTELKREQAAQERYQAELNGSPLIMMRRYADKYRLTLRRIAALCDGEILDDKETLAVIRAECRFALERKEQPK